MLIKNTYKSFFRLYIHNKITRSFIIIYKMLTIIISLGLFTYLLLLFLFILVIIITHITLVVQINFLNSQLIKFFNYLPI